MGEGIVCPVKVILVEDDPMVREVHRQFIEKIDGFTIIGTAANGVEGEKLVRELHPDLAIIDLYMPHLGGVEMLKKIRSNSLSVDVIAITAANDIDTIHQVLQQGAIDYIIKPFTFDRIKKSLENYKLYQTVFTEKETIRQAELDEIIFKSGRENNGGESLPKGLNMNTLTKVTLFMSQVERPVSAEEVAESIGIARITARRYLDFLEKEGKVKLYVQYGGVGRPVNRYAIN
ncbi:response regulator [Neobacillus sp. OS1-32]|jgi:two-component system response regulator DctR|uniref:response regulator n=1 Tax=Neobacillus sp. OS1-32 TaxID=3070682 RepID=UPI0027DF4F74|nr:response regulator [Neobacillus sp. OS1-32]WML31488.1 response regulator [Neobacillus sp. OS1-32]